MPRQPRNAPGGYVYHALNRATARLTLFRKPPDYDAFLRVLAQALDRHPTRLLAYCLMPTHWHLVLWPEHDGQLSALVRWLTLTHSVRGHTHYHSTGSGHVYQNRFKAFPIQEDEHLLTVLRYVERNPLRAGLVARAQDWKWSSLADQRARRRPAVCTPERCLGRGRGSTGSMSRRPRGRWRRCAAGWRGAAPTGRRRGPSPW